MPETAAPILETHMSHRVLIIDDDRDLVSLLKRSLEGRGYEVRGCPSGAAGLRAFFQDPAEAILLDLNLPDTSGIEVLKKIMKADPEAAVIMITAHGEVQTAVEAMKLGAFDYVAKPFELEELEIILKSALNLMALKDEVSILKRMRAKDPSAKIVAASPAMKNVMELVRKVSQSPDTTVLITGESGTGKELVANAIHYQSPRRGMPLITVCCTVLKEQLLESELFGHEAGAFTDAKSTKKGLFEVAHGGTVFLDEIGDMDVKLQSKLLRVLESRTFRRLGGLRDISVDVRILAATNKNLEEEVRKGTMRNDLYFRLRIVPICIPPLRERRADVAPLLRVFIEEYNRQFNRRVSGITPEAEAALRAYPWPGNIRELKNLIERIFILENPAEIGLEHLPAEVRRESGAPEPAGVRPTGPPGEFKRGRQEAIERFEKGYLEGMLTSCGGNVSRGAAAARMTRSNFQRLMKKYGISSRQHART